MQGARSLALVVAGALLLSAASARADQPVPAPPGDPGDRSQTERPQDQRTPDDSANPTWFGMGFESRQERFRRDMGLPVGQPGGAGPAGGNGRGGPGAGH